MKTYKSLKSAIGDERTILIVCPDCEFEGLDTRSERIFIYDCLFHCLDGRSSQEATLIEHYIKALRYHQIVVLAQNSCKAMTELATNEAHSTAEGSEQASMNEPNIPHEHQTEDLVLSHIKFLEDKSFMKRCMENNDVVIKGFIWDSASKELVEVH